MIEIIPAIDLRNGKCVRLHQGNYDEETIYGDDPVAMARRWQTEGATRLHVVDLDGAHDGIPANIKIVERIVDALTIPVQLGGGLRDSAVVQRVLDMGVDRCIIGTKAAQQPEWAQQMFAQFGTSIILGLDARDEMVATAGWRETTALPAVDFARAMEAAGCARIIFTDIARDGTLAGPNAIALRKICEAVEIPVIASGGVHKATDIRILRNIPHVEGLIVGKALYAGTTSLRELQEISRESDPAQATA